MNPVNAMGCLGKDAGCSVARRFLVLSLAIISVWSAGCGKRVRPSGGMHGSVDVQGTPLSRGVVVVFSEEGFGGTAPLREDGTFAIDGLLPVGEYRVWFERPSGGDDPRPDSAPSASQKTPPWPPQNLPREYLSERDTPLRITIGLGQNELPIKISE